MKKLFIVLSVILLSCGQDCNTLSVQDNLIMNAWRSGYHHGRLNVYSGNDTNAARKRDSLEIIKILRDDL